MVCALGRVGHMPHRVEVRQGKTILGDMSEREFLDACRDAGIDTYHMTLFGAMTAFNEWSQARGDGRQVIVVMGNDEPELGTNPRRAKRRRAKAKAKK